MRIVILVAMTADRLIGRDGGLPWHEPEDLKHFKRTTLGHSVIMGRRTYESIGKPLPGRWNIVVSGTLSATPSAPDSGKGSTEARAGDFRVVATLDDALQLCRERGEQVAFIIGGARLFEAALAIADEMIITEIDRSGLIGDTYFPGWDPRHWRPAGREPLAPHLTIARYVRTTI